MPVAGSCHCGAVRIAAPSPPDWVTSCKCSICRRLGWLVAYYSRDQVSVRGATAAYWHGEQLIAFHHCPVCACTTHWEPATHTLERDDLPDDVRSLLANRVGINARLLDGYAESDGQPAIEGRPLEVRFRDNAGR